MAWMVAYLLKPWDTDGVITPAVLLGRPAGDASGLESLAGIAPADGYETVMRKQAERKEDPSPI